MPLLIFRSALLVLLSRAGYASSPFPTRRLFGLALGAAAALVVIALELRLRAVQGNHVVGILVGGVTGLIGARLIWGALAGVAIQGEHFFHVMVIVFMVYLGMAIGARQAEWFEPAGRI